MPPAVQRFALCAISSTTLVVLALVAALAGSVFSPAGAAPADDYEADAQLIADVRGYAQETASGYEHVSRWMRVLKSLGALETMTAAEAQGFADEYLATRWTPVVEALQALEAGQAGYEPDEQLIADLRGYAGETQNGYEHVVRWFRALNTLGALEAMTASEAQGYADRGWSRWVPVAEALLELEAAVDSDPADTQSPGPATDPKTTTPATTELRVSVSASSANPRVNEAVILSPVVANEPEAGSPTYRWEIEGNGDWHAYGSRAELQYLAAQAESWTFRVTLTYDSGQSATSDPFTVTWSVGEPNQAPVVNKQAEDYPWFTGQNNAPRGTLVSKQFYQIFDDPDGDELTYSVAITGGDSSLVDDLQVTTEAGRKPRSWPPYGTYYRVWFQADGEDDWKALSPTLPDRPVVTVTLTATDPDGLPASVSGDFVIGWESYPEVVSATTDGETIELTFDWPVEGSPSPNPGQFTVRAVNDDGSSGSVGVNSVAVNGKLVTLELASALTRGQTVTLDYAYLYHLDSHNPLQRAGGGDHAPGFSGQAVEFLEAPGEPQNFSVSAEAGELDLSASWDALDGVTFYQLRWRQSGGQFEAADASTVSDTHTTVTVSAYGQWDVLLQGCNDAGCGPEVSQSVELYPLARPQGFTVSVEAGELILSATWDALDGATSYRLRWRQDGGEFEAANAATVSKTNATITVSDYGQWEVLLQGCNDGGCGPEAAGSVEVVRVTLTPPENFAVNVEQGLLAVKAEWDSVKSATSYQLRWRESGGEFEAANAVTVSDTETTITLSDYGEWEIRLQACNDAGCVPEAGGSADEAPVVRLSLQPAGEAGVRAQSSAQSRAQARTLTAPQNAVDGGNSYTLGWRRDEADAPTPAQSQADVQRLRSVTSGPSGQAGPTNTTAPRLLRGEIDGDTMTFYFSEPLDEDAVGSRFRVTLYFRNGWTNFTAHPSKVEVNGNKVVVFGLSRNGWPGWPRASRGHRVQAYYYIDDRVVPASERLRDLDGNEVWTPHRSLGGHFPATRTIRLTNLTEPPLLKRATAHPRWLTLTFDEALFRNSVPAADAFTVRVNGSVVSLASVEPVSVSGDTVTLALASPLTSSDTVQVSYAKPSRSRLRGLDGDAKNFSNRWATNLVGAVPSVSNVAITSTPADGEAYAPGETITVALTFSEAVTVSGAPRLQIEMAANYRDTWAKYSGGSGTATLTFGYTVVEPDRSTRGVAVLRDRLALNGGAIRSVATQQDAHRWYARLDHDPDHMVDWHRSAPGVPWVIGVKISSNPGNDGSYALSDTIQVTATFSEAVNVDITGGTPRLGIRLAPHFWWMATDDEERWADYSGGSGTAELTFDYQVMGTNRSLNGMAVLQNTLELNGGTIRSTTTSPVDAHLRYEGLWHDQNHRVDGSPPSLVGVSVSGATLSLTYPESMDEGSAPPASAFTVKRIPQGGAEETVGLTGPPVIAAGAVFLSLTDPVLVTDSSVTVSYDRAAAGVGSRLKDKAGNEAASFSNQAADPTDTTRPRLLRGEIDGDTMTFYFSEPLDEDIRRDANLYRINLFATVGSPNFGRCFRNGITFTTRPREVYVIGNTAVVIGLYEDIATRRAAVAWNLINSSGVHADITAPVEHRLRDLSGNALSTPFYHSERYRETKDIDYLDNVTRLPSPERVIVRGDRLILTFDAPLDGGRTPAASAFTVNVDGSEVSLSGANPVSVSGRTVTLTLASAVAAGANVRVSYERPSERWLRNVICEYAPSFSDEPANNFTGVSRASASITSDPGNDNTYGRSDVIRVRLTFSEAVTVTGAARLKITMDPGYGEQWASYESGSGTDSLMFSYRVKQPNSSPRGIAVLADSLELTYGSIRYTASGSSAYLAHGGLNHNPNHKVDWQR